MADDKLGLLVQLLLDKGKAQEVKKGFEDTAKSIEKADDNIQSIGGSFDELGDDFKKFTNEFDKTFKLMDGKLRNTKTNAEVTADELRKFTKIDVDAARQVEASAEDVAKAIEQEKKEVAELNAEIKSLAKFSNLSEKQVADLSDEMYEAGKDAQVAQKKIDVFNKELQETERRVSDLNQIGSSIEGIGRGLFLAGSAVTGALYLAANNEAERIKEAGGAVDETTQKWLTAQKRIELSYQRVGRVALTALLPSIEKIAALAEKASKFIEKNPDLVKAAVNTAGVVATIGAIGMLVGRGIRFVADATLIAAQFKYAASTALFKQTVDKFMTGVGKMGAASAGTGMAGTLASAAVSIVAGVIASGVAVSLVNQLLEATGVNDKIDAARATARGGNAKIYPGLINDPEQRKLQVQLNKAIDEGDTAEIERLKEAMDKAIESTEGLTEGLDDLSEYSEAAQADVEGFKIIKDLERENLEAEREYQRDRAEIIKKSTDAIMDATTRLAQAESKIRAGLASTLSKLAQNFAKENAQAEQQYQQDRADAIRDGNQEVLDIQKNAQEQMRQLEEDFALEKDELTRQRDALGLAKAEREFERNKSEIEKGKEDEIAESRRQTAERLAEMRRSYLQERSDRAAKYKQDVADAKAQAAQELVEARTAFNERMNEIRKQKAEELNELLKAYNEERRRRILSAYDQIKDLGNAQNAERAMKSRYYSIILSEASAFMTNYAAILKPKSGTYGTLGGGTALTGTKADGGYVTDGVYRMHKKEFVMTAPTVSAAESLIGSQLTQQTILSRLAGGGRGSLTINDARRFDSSIPVAERRAIESDAADLALNRFAEFLEG